ncbi:hypothetical protein KP509_12G069800 [Ceratopteris richardii]|uniref:Uncharacterized protein n=1 Tax=Ceratopteris richardii TaxID=49495 RepID=A0A8T2TPS4_CERRI|nr:hypothetical protein KP509_12G069800 [Ceratopteris richardii]
MKAMSKLYRLSSRCLMHSSPLHLAKSESAASLSNLPAQPQELDFFKTADILFSEEDPKRRKKFGWDFHLWQAFVACLPSVAVYLTAQYARYDMRRIEAEREREAAEKREVVEKKEDEEALKKPGFRVLHERLGKMEEKISELESKATQTAGKVEDKPKITGNSSKFGNAGVPSQGEGDAKSTVKKVQFTSSKEEPKEEHKDRVKSAERNAKEEENLQKSSQDLPSRTAGAIGKDRKTVDDL